MTDDVELIDDLDIERTISTQAKTATPSTAEQTITADEGYAFSGKTVYTINGNEATVTRVPFVTYDEQQFVGTFVRYAERQEVLPEIRENLIVEFYNR